MKKINIKILQLSIIIILGLSSINLFALANKDLDNKAINDKQQFAIMNEAELQQKKIDDAKKAKRLAFVSELLDNPFSNLWIITTSATHASANSSTMQDYGGNQFLFQPIIPLEVNNSFRLISRPTFTFYTQQFNLMDPQGQPAFPNNNLHSAGFGDFALVSMIAPNKKSGYIWAVGPSFATALTDNSFSSSNPKLGFSVAQVYLGHQYYLGALYIQNFQLNADTNQDKKATFQYYISYKLSSKWSINMNPTVEINYSASKGEKLNLPIGIGIGRTMIVGVPVRVSLEVDRYILTPDNTNIQPETTIALKMMTVIPNLLKYHERLF